MFKISERAKHLKQSCIRSASTRCAAINGINLGQGLCDLPTPDIIKEAAYQDMRVKSPLKHQYIATNKSMIYDSPLEERRTKG
jgi:hypothetical protein